MPILAERLYFESDIGKHLFLAITAACVCGLVSLFITINQILSLVSFLSFLLLWVVVLLHLLIYSVSLYILSLLSSVLVVSLLLHYKYQLDHYGSQISF